MTLSTLNFASRILHALATKMLTFSLNAPLLSLLETQPIKCLPVRLKALKEDNLNLVKIIMLFFDKEENVVGKVENDFFSGRLLFQRH